MFNFYQLFIIPPKKKIDFPYLCSPTITRIPRYSKYTNQLKMSSGSEAMSKRKLIATIADEDTVTGLLLAGIGQVSNEPGKETNFLTVIPGKTSVEDIDEAFENFTKERDDIAILLINQHLADLIRYKVDSYTNAFPAILEIPSKDHPYDPEKDSILKRVRRLFGE